MSDTKGREDLKSYFVRNAIPTEQNFAELIDAQLNQRDDGIFKRGDEPLSVVAAGGAQRRALRIYSAPDAPDPDWTLSLNPAQDPADAGTTRAGLGFADLGGQTRLFIDSGSGRVGVGTNAPRDALDVREGNLRVEGGAGRRLVVISDRRDARLDLVTRNQGEAGRPSIHFIHGDLDAPVYGVRLSAVDNQRLHVESNAGGGQAHLSVDGPLTCTALRAAGSETPIAVDVEGGYGNWARFRVTAEPNWGDAGKKYVTIGAGGADGIMLHNPHASWNSNRASIRYGRARGEPGKTFWDAGVESNGSFFFDAYDDGGIGRAVTITKAGELQVRGGVSVEHNMSNHVNRDGAFYRYGGQVYITMDDNLYIRDHRRGAFWHFDGTSQTFKTPVLRLGDKWRLSGVGDGGANDDWLRLYNVQNTDYYGGLAAHKLWTGSGGGTVSSSDIAFKRDVRAVSPSLSGVMQLRAVGYRGLADGPDGPEHLGMIAQEVQAVFPQLVEEGPDGYLGIKYNGFIGLLVEAIKEQQAQIDALRAAVSEA